MKKSEKKDFYRFYFIAKYDMIDRTNVRQKKGGDFYSKM